MSSEEYYKETFIIIPAYNEKAAISKVLGDLSALGCVIIVVDDGSLEDIKEEVRKYKEVVYLRHKVNLGQGAALQTGIDFAIKQAAKYIVSFDADGQHSAADIPEILSPVFSGEADIVLASRFLVKGKHNASMIKKIVLKGGRWVNYFFTGLYLSDAHNGLRAMNRLAAITIRISENRMAHATEITAQIKKHKLRYKEVAANVIYTPYSRQKGQSSLNSLKIFFDLVLQKLFR
ncbi:MAG: glycosyltransferase family 2 protein [Chitinophagaceae bacterium]